MESLQVKSIKKLDIFKDKTLLQISLLCTDGNNPNAVKYRDILFRSRGTLIALFEIYMTKPIAGLMPNEQTIQSKWQRKNFLDGLLLRQDVQTGAECENYFNSLVRGFAWNYNVVLRADAEDDELHIAMPSAVCFEPFYEIVHNDITIIGTLPSDECLGCMFNIHISYEIDGIEIGGKMDSLLCFWKKEDNIQNGVEFKKFLFRKVLTKAKRLARLNNEHRFMLRGPDIEYYGTLRFNDFQPPMPDGLIMEGVMRFGKFDAVAEALANSPLDFTVSHRHGGAFPNVTLRLEYNEDRSLQFMIEAIPFTIQ